MCSTLDKLLITLMMTHNLTAIAVGEGDNRQPIRTSGFLTQMLLHLDVDQLDEATRESLQALLKSVELSILAEDALRLAQSQQAVSDAEVAQHVYNLLAVMAARAKDSGRDQESILLEQMREPYHSGEPPRIGLGSQPPTQCHEAFGTSGTMAAVGFRPTYAL